MFDILETEDFPYICPKCGSHWSTLRLLREHLELEHSLKSSLRTRSSLSAGITKVKHSPVKMTDEAIELQRRLRLSKDAENRQKHAMLNQSSKVSALKAEMQQLAEAVKEQQDLSNLALQKQRQLLKQERDEQQNLLAASLANTREHLETIRITADKTTADQHKMINHLQQQLEQRDAQLEATRTQLNTLTQERLNLQLEVKDLRQEQNDNDQHLDHLQQIIDEKEKEIMNKQHEMGILSAQFQDDSAQQIHARAKLQEYIEQILHRAETAEAQIRQFNKASSLSHISEYSAQPIIEGAIGEHIDPFTKLSRSVSADALSDYMSPVNGQLTHLQHLSNGRLRASGYEGSGSDQSEEMIIPVQSDPLENPYSANGPSQSANRTYRHPQIHNGNGQYPYQQQDWTHNLPIDDHGIIWDGSPQFAEHYSSKLHNHSTLSPRQDPLQQIFLPSTVPYCDSEADTGYGTYSHRFGQEPSVVLSDADTMPTPGRERTIPGKPQYDAAIDLKCEKWRLREKMQMLRAKERVLKTNNSIDSTSDSFTSVTEGTISSFGDSSDTDPTVVTVQSMSPRLESRGHTPHPPTYPRSDRSISPHRTLHLPSISQEHYCNNLASHESFDVESRQDVLFCVFMYLDLPMLQKMALVCHEWKNVSRNPALWQHIVLSNSCISSKFLVTISQWCTQVHSLTLQGLSARHQRYEEGPETYKRNTRGCLEAGLEQLFRSCCNTLVSLKVINCNNILTDRCLWLASCYCRCLQRVAYISKTDPLGSEVIWAMGAGCRDISTLIVPPLMPNVQPEKFSNKCVQMIGRCWPELCVLCIGGSHIDLRGLTAIARLCSNLHILELDHMDTVDEANAVSMCRAGLLKLQTLDFTFTPVSASAVTHFARACPKIKCIKVNLSLNAYFGTSQASYTRVAFDQMVSDLQDLQKDQLLKKILQLKVDYNKGS